MSNGYSLHIGLNKVDKKAYPGMPELGMAVKDAVDWQKFARKKGFETRILKNSRAKADTVLSALNDLCESARAGDLVLITYSGHGGQIANNIPGREFPEAYDQTWCLYDRELLDEEIYDCFSRFRKAVRIVVVSDSCHSGTITKDLQQLHCGQLLNEGLELLAPAYGHQIKSVPPGTAGAHYVQNEELYTSIQQKLSTKKFSMKAAVKLLAACQDDEVTYDGPQNGIFTASLLALLNNPMTAGLNAAGLYKHSGLAYHFPHPNLFVYGSVIPSFDRHSPFEINIPEPKKVSGMRKPRQRDFKLRPSHSIKRGRGTLKGSIPAVLRIRVNDLPGVQFVSDAQSTILNEERSEGLLTLQIRLDSIAYEYAWTAAHAIHAALADIFTTVEVSPVLAVAEAGDGRITREADINNPNYLTDWPPALRTPAVPIGWHLDDEHSQLSRAALTVRAHNPAATVRIAHLDTGYQPHAALPAYLLTGLARSFVAGEDPAQALDRPGSGGQEGHGLGTLTLLAGNKVGLADTFEEFEGYIGAIPWAEVLPIRVSDSVVIWNTDSFCKAIDYAISQGCEVVSMSMAGKADKDLAAAVNRAYEAGVVIVSAAGNNWYRGTGAILPKCVLYPAAFERVLAATGAMYDHKPYNKPFLNRSRFKIGTKFMQGSYGPASKMKYALAAYTPNTPWASTALPFVRSGGGTSSATPQIAAAAALYIAHHRAEMEAKGYYAPGQQWKKVEAVRRALFNAAAREEKFKEWKKYFGNGILRAYNALSEPVASTGQLTQAPPAEVAWQGWFEVLRAFLHPRYRSRKALLVPVEALIMELLDLLQTDPALYAFLDELDLNDKQVLRRLVKDAAFIKVIMDSPYASVYLKAGMGTLKAG